MYYLSAVPSEFNLFGIVAVNIGVAVFSWLILIMPARLASSISPAKTMRYE
jgi:ABC-type lipoprotein release transport system permease subunit